MEIKANLEKDLSFGADKVISEFVQKSSVLLITLPMCIICIRRGINILSEEYLRTIT